MTVIITLAIALPTLAVWMRAAWLVETYGRQLREALATVRRDAEHAAADPAPLGAPRLRLVYLHEHHEQLVTAAVRRHPQMSPDTDPGMPTPGAGGHRTPAPGVRPKP